MKRLGRPCAPLIIAGAAIVLLILGVRQMLFHTWLGLGAIASILSAMGAMQFEGLQGTLGSGFHADRITIRSTGRPASEIVDIDVLYRLEGWLHRGFVVEEVSVGKPTLYVDTGRDRKRDESEHDVDSTAAIDFLRIDRVDLANIVLFDPANDYQLAIDEIEWTGFRVGDGAFDPGSLTVESDRVDVKTLPGDTVPVDGEPVEFQKRFVATIAPAPRSSIRDAIDVDIRVAVEPGKPRLLLRAFAEALEIRLDLGLRGLVRARALDLTRYFAG